MKRKSYILILSIVFTMLLAGCTKKIYKVVFNYNDDTNFTETIELEDGSKVKEPVVDVLKFGYDFKHWNNSETNKKYNFTDKLNSDLVLEGVWEKDSIRRGTFGREYPSYYELGVPLIDDAHLVYINFDGFAKYYYDESIKRDPNSLPTLTNILKEGTIFSDFRTTTPSITNPSQNMIISGATTKETKNVYRYYDRDTNKVIQQLRENESETIIDKVIESDLSIASISFYLAEPQLSSTDPNKIHITPDNTNPAVVDRGPDKYSDYFSRFEQAMKLVKGEPIKNSSGTVVVEKLPKYIMIYADDLDAYGHNERTVYGVPVSLSENERMDKVVNALREMDEKLGEFIKACKEAGVYEKMTFMLTTDHGMTPFGAISGDQGGQYLNSKIGELKYSINQYNKKFEFEKVEVDSKPGSRTNVVGVGMNLNIQLTFTEGIDDSELEGLKEHLLKENYVGVVKTRKELDEEGYWIYAADMIISPAERYNFAPNVLSQYRVRGQHDSYLSTSQSIFGVAWGKGIKKNYDYKETAYNYDFGITMAAILGLDLPNANGIVLDIFETKNEKRK